jgi:ComF family protein
VQNLKFHQDLAAARLFGRLLADTLPPAKNQNTLIVPVPLHRKRLVERGYNQALEIARPLRQRGYRLEPRCVRRNTPTRAQSTLPQSQRRSNLRDAFSASLRLDGLHVILIDDVLTTGTTLDELATTLKRAGAQRVEAMVVARTLRESAGERQTDSVRAIRKP